MSTIIIRGKRDSDLDALEAIFRMNRGPEIGWLNPERPDDCLAEQSEGEAVLLAEDGDQVIGFVSIWEPEHFIHHLYVHTDHQRRGVGGMLVRAVAERCPGDLTLKCVNANLQAMDFYRKTGWTVVSTGIGSDGEYSLLRLASPG